MIKYTVYNKCNLFKATKLIVYLTVLVVFAVILSDTANYNGYVSTVQADEDEYSQEEIDAAKAWLSAHGYPPTRAGAEQAYQDTAKAGGQKMEWVVDYLYTLVPVMIKPFISRDMVQKLVQAAFDAMKKFADSQLDKVVDSIGK